MPKTTYAATTERNTIHTRSSDRAYTSAVIYVRTNGYEAAWDCAASIEQIKKHQAAYQAKVDAADAAGLAEDAKLSGSSTLAQFRAWIAGYADQLVAIEARRQALLAAPDAIAAEWATFHGSPALAQKAASSYRYASRAYVVPAVAQAPKAKKVRS